MRLSQSAADGALPLLHASVAPEIESVDFIVHLPDSLRCVFVGAVQLQGNLFRHGDRVHVVLGVEIFLAQLNVLPNRSSCTTTMEFDMWSNSVHAEFSSTHVQALYSTGTDSLPPE